MRLGFVAKPLARPDLRSHDSRRWQNGPHLSVSLAYLRDIFAYLNSAGITMYRMSSDLAPYASHPSLPQFHSQVPECVEELAEMGGLASRAGVRLSFHSAASTVLNSPVSEVSAKAASDLGLLTSILDAMRAGPEAVVVTHLGGVYGAAATARERAARTIDDLPAPTRSRLALENDDVRFGVEDALWVHRRTGTPVVFDRLHHLLHGFEAMTELDALTQCLNTWSPSATPKIHWSSPRTEWLLGERRSDEAPRVTRTRWTYHSDYVNPFEFIAFMRNAVGLRPFDVMLEARAKDMALVQLRRDLARYAPDLASSLQPPDPC